MTPSNDFYDSVSQYNPPDQKVYVDAGVSSASAVPSPKFDEPEPIPNAFDGGDEAAQEERTVAPVGPANEVHMKDSTAVSPGDATHVADIQADDRAPVGLDAGALEVTAAEHDEGGWHGGANEANKRDAPEADADKPEAKINKLD